MKKRLNIIRKIFFAIMCCILVLGFINYEVYSVKKKEYERQTEIANNSHEQIKLNLNMLKIAIQTNDIDKYAENLSNLYENTTTIESLFLIKEEQNDFLSSIKNYAELLETKKNLLTEITNLKQDISKIEKKFKNNYSDKGAITRELLADASNVIAKLKIDEKKYTEKPILTTVTTTNKVLDGIIAKSNTLTECIDNCYKNRINEINDELAEIIKEFTDQTISLNKAIEDQFDLTTLDKLKES